MKRLLTILAFLAVLPAAAQYRSGYADLDDSPTVRQLREHVSFLASAALEGRRAGSPGEAEAADYLRQALESAGVEMLSGSKGDVFGISRASDTLSSRNVFGVVQGYDPVLRDRYIVVGARLDNLGTNVLTVDGEPVTQTYYGANGNASGLAMLVELARKVAGRSVLFRRSVVFVGFGASCEGFAGAWYFLNRSFAGRDAVDAMINLDMLGTGTNGFYAYTASNPDMNVLLEQVNATLEPVLPQLVSMEPVNSDHRIFYDKEIPAVFFTTGRYPEYNTDRDTASILEYDGMERELEYLYNFTLALTNGRRPDFRREAAPALPPP